MMGSPNTLIFMVFMERKGAFGPRPSAPFPQVPTGRRRPKGRIGKGFTKITLHNGRYRITNIRRVLDRIEEFPESETAVSGGYRVMVTTASIIYDHILSFYDVSTEKLHQDLKAMAAAMQEKRRLKACLRKTEYANLIKD